MKQRNEKGYDLFDENSRRLIIILVALLFITGITKSSQFLNVGNVQSIGKQLTEYGLMSLGMGVCMLSGGMDLFNRLYRKSLWY